MIQIENLEIYTLGDQLGVDEYLLKLRPEEDYHTKKRLMDTGFLAKLTQKKEIPKSFSDWNIRHRSGEVEELPIYVYNETFRYGWKLKGWRYGQSQNWATLIHPDGFTLEIYLSTFLNIALDTTIVNGELQGQFKWHANSLIKYENGKETEYSNRNY
jgi:hypothetical protein